MLLNALQTKAAKSLIGATIALSLVAVAPTAALADEGTTPQASIATQTVFEQVESNANQQKLQNIVQRANEELGTPYRNGGVGPSGYDCSGLVGYCVTGEHARLGTTWTYLAWDRITPEEAQPGDIVVCSSHTGIYIGDGMMIHAPRTGKVVEVAEVYSNMIYVKAPSYLIA